MEKIINKNKEYYYIDGNTFLKTEIENQFCNIILGKGIYDAVLDICKMMNVCYN